MICKKCGNEIPYNGKINKRNVISKLLLMIFTTVAVLLIAIVIMRTAKEEKSSKGFINAEGYYIFGSYEQDGNESNGPEPIEWVILDENENGTLLISRYVLDCVQYNTVEVEVTWESCSLRYWMNNEFYNTAFDDSMKANINTVTIVNEDNQLFGTPGGNNTSDKVFCLSVSDILKYYDFNSWYSDKGYGFSQALITPATKYAESRGVYTETVTNDDYTDMLSENKYSEDCIGMTGAYWWLRSPGNDSSCACFVYDAGSAGAYSRIHADSDDRGVRPALYINK
ncbi:MAG: DUF6273 domain-containing protein [Lachnospiraceae bacterium]|nr:DUF6273 domain-containing protein [Lachnospiraceae bacterium]